MNTTAVHARIPLSKLHLSPLNARKTRTGDVDDLAEMADGSDRVIDFASIARDLLALRAFIDDVFGDELGDIDGGTLQSLAEKHGLLKRVLMKSPCREEGCACAEYLDAEDWPSNCYRRTSRLTGNQDTDARIAALEAEQAKAG